MGSMYTSLFSGWCFTNNNPWIDKGRIIIAWNPRVFSLDIKLCTTQLIHCLVQLPNQTGRFLITFVYGFNDDFSWEQLWNDLQELAVDITEPWMVIGDFNEILSLHERIGKKVTTKISSKFLECLTSCHLEDLKFSGCFYTWNNKQRAEDKMQLDKKPFRYFWMWKEAPCYEDKIQTSWNMPVVGTPMFQVISKLKKLKQELQEKLQKDPLNDRLITQEQMAREQYLHYHKAYMMFLAQKAKAVWMVNGDENTHIFHASLKARRIQNRIMSIKTEAGIWVDSPVDIKKAFFDYYQGLLGTGIMHRKRVSRSIMKLGPVLNVALIQTLTTDFSTQEVKDVMFAIPGLKAPGPVDIAATFIKIIGIWWVQRLLQLCYHSSIRWKT
ncbi:uncharacterized protein LOC133814436 [Humulus lupulus]|uniref:uncharacterized protein LOC133814436 n=1 Tax=Humulus lupulus TaxID=3486 RepID=UPI002B40BF0B|nr:uncharacterized protein LOC133814436 [Humulus lupulus]